MVTAFMFMLLHSQSRELYSVRIVQYVLFMIEVVLKFQLEEIFWDGG